MATIQIFDPAMCCATGVCGVDVDQALVSFAARRRPAEVAGAERLLRLVQPAEAEVR